MQLPNAMQDEWLTSGFRYHSSIAFDLSMARFLSHLVFIRITHRKYLKLSKEVGKMNAGKLYKKMYSIRREICYWEDQIDDDNSYVQNDGLRHVVSDLWDALDRLSSKHPSIYRSMCITHKIRRDIFWLGSVDRYELGTWFQRHAPKFHEHKTLSNRYLKAHHQWRGRFMRLEDIYE